jgi:hypothetical protein
LGQLSRKFDADLCRTDIDEMLTLLYFRCANPSYTVSELVHVLQLSKSKVILVHPPSLSVAVEAAKQVGLSAKNIIVFNVPGESTPGGFATIDDLIVKGLRRPQGYVEPILKAGEAKTKLAFLSFSSGTTGKPKVSCPCSGMTLESDSMTGSVDSALRCHSQCDSNGLSQRNGSSTSRRPLHTGWCCTWRYFRIYIYLIARRVLII